MKIETSPIRITGKIHLLKNLKEGNVISAKITDRLGHNRAILDINGRKINAEFLQGVPDTGKLSLILESKTDSALFFRIAGALVGESIPELKRFIILTQSDLYKSLHNSKLSLKKEMGIFELNKALLEFTGLTKSNNINTTGLFNKLLMLGVDHNTILLLNALIYGTASRAFQQIYRILSHLSRDSKNLNNFNDIGQINELIDDLIDYIKGTDDDLIREILNLLVNRSSDKENQFGEIAYFDDNKYKECKYIIYNDNIILSLNMSFLGDLDILIREEKSYYSIFFFCKKEECQIALKSEILALEESLSPLLEKNFNILFYNNKKAVEKIIDIITAIDINYLLDIKA